MNAHIAINKPKVDFSQFDSLTDWNTKRDMLLKASGVLGKEYNTFIRASIRYFYGQGNRQIRIINGLLLIAFQSRGFNTARLGSYLKQVVPHEYHNDGSKKAPPYFGKKLEDGEYDIDKMTEFLALNPEWHKFGREQTTNAFVPAKYLENVLKKLHTEKVDVVKFTADLIEAEKEYRAAKASK